MLPSSFPKDKLSATDALKVEWFYNRFVEDYYRHYTFGHFLLAAYAAVPGLLTPDLLYKIWLNFNTYTWSGKNITIHRIAVADILLSPLCREIGSELYEMQPEIRMALLEWMNTESLSETNNKRGFATIEKISIFLQEYYQRPNPARFAWGDQFLESQLLDALSFLQPVKAAGLLKARIREAVSTGNETSLLRAIDDFTKTHQRLKRLLPASRQDVLVLYEKENHWLEAGKALIQQNPDRFRSLLEAHENLGDWLTTDEEGAIPVKVEAGLMKRLEELEKPMLRVLMVGVGNDRAVNDVALMESCFSNMLLPEQLSIVKLTGPEINKQKISAAFERLANEVKSQDQVVIYFSCDSRKALTEDRAITLICEVDGNNQPVTDASRDFNYREMRAVTDALACKQILLILESPFSGTDQWMTIAENNGHAIIASCAIDQAPQLRELELMDEKAYSFFTYEFARQLNRKQGDVSLRRLFNRIIEGFGNMSQVRSLYGGSIWNIRNEHNPQLFASPEMVETSFIPGVQLTIALQVGLQQAGLYNEHVSGVHTGKLTRAINRYKSDILQLPELNNSEVLRELTKKNGFKSEKPIFLLVFSDPDKRLKEIQWEQTRIVNMLRPFVKKLGIELLISTGQRKELTNLFMSPEFRDRIELFYYSGFDDFGDMIFKDGKITVHEMINMLEFQRKLQLVFLNTCRSQHAANWLAQIGNLIAVGGEELITDEYGAEYAIRFFNLLTTGAPLTEYISINEALDPRLRAVRKDRLQIFMPPFRKTTETFSWKGEAALLQTSIADIVTQAPSGKILAVCLAIRSPEIAPELELPFAVGNTETFAGWLNTYGETISKPVKVLLNLHASRGEALDSLDLFSTAQPGDTCVLFYAGVTIKDAGSNEHFAELVFEDDTRKGLAQLKGADLFWQRLNSVLSDKKVNLVIIADSLYDVGIEPGIVHTAGLTKNAGVDLIILEKELLPGVVGLPGNYYFIALNELLQDAAMNVSYSQLISRLKIQMAAHSDLIRIRTEGSQRGWEHFVVFTTKGREENNYEAIYIPERERWVINAGTRKGIRPSLNFMKTIFVVNDNVEFFVTESDVSISWLSRDSSNLETLDKTVRYPARLLQNALPKIKVAFGPEMDPELQEQLLKSIAVHDIYYIDIMNTITDAKFLICSYDASYYLVRSGENLNSPVFGYQQTPFEFIKQMEYVAQWTGVLDFDNTQSDIDKTAVHVDFIVWEGVSHDSVEDPNTAGTVTNPEALHLRYKNDICPSFRCAVGLSTDAPQESYYVNVLYLDSDFAISSSLLKGGHVLRRGETIELSYQGKGRIPVRISSQTRKQGIKSIYEYCKFFISNTPIDLKDLEQDALSIEVAQHARSLGIYERKDTVRIPDNRWTTLTIPINIKLEDEILPFKEQVEQLYKQQPVTTDEDLQKDRWGGESFMNGWSLQATVTASITPGLFNVYLNVVRLAGLVPEANIAFFLHDSFKNEIQYAKQKNGKASIKVIAYEAFTVGVYVSDGTMLELDLNEVPGFPGKFYYQEVHDEFRKYVTKLYRGREITVPDDPQKNRWGNNSIVRGKRLTAIVKDATVPGYYKVTLSVTGIEISLRGNVAFFLHDSFAREIKFRRTINGMATISILAYEAFTVGAYTEDGTTLELDLNSISGAPVGFYYPEV